MDREETEVAQASIEHVSVPLHRSRFRVLTGNIVGTIVVSIEQGKESANDEHIGVFAKNSHCVGIDI